MKNIEKLNELINRYGLEFDGYDDIGLEDFIENNAKLLYIDIYPRLNEVSGKYDKATVVLAGSDDGYETDFYVSMEENAMILPRHYELECEVTQ